MDPQLKKLGKTLQRLKRQCDTTNPNATLKIARILKKAQAIELTMKQIMGVV
jgi:hypothetical protein